MFRSDFSKYEICSESFTKTLYGQVFGKWIHFQIILSLWELEVMTVCYACIAEKSLNRLLWLLLKSSNQRWSVKKCALKNFAKFTGNHLCWSLFIIKLQAWGPATFFKRDSDTGVLRWNLQRFWEHLFWRAFVNPCVLLYLHRWFSLQRLKKLWWRFIMEIFCENS